MRIAPDPQLSVCKGIVANEVQKLKYGQPILMWRCCRASYGMLCRELYNKHNPEHIGRPTTREPLNGKLYVNESIAWFIKKVLLYKNLALNPTDNEVQGETMSNDELIVKDFSKKVSLGTPLKLFPTSIVSSEIDTNLLPNRLTDGMFSIQLPTM